MNLLIGTLIGVTLVEICLIASLLIDQNNGTEDKNFSTNAEEWPQGSKLVFDSDVAFRSDFIVHQIVLSDAGEIASVR